MPLRSPRHGCASAYAHSGLFKDLGSFTDLERRIEQLPSEKERGDAFEVFVEAYLSTDEIAQAEDVWVTGKVPGEVRQRLNLPPTDYGYDGVYRSRLGELVAYQAKFRTGRTSLPYAELATFLGITEKAERRVVLTNAMAMSTVAESRTGFQTTRGGDFDRLDAAQLAAIAAWIEGTAAPPLLREPRPHQQAAMADIATELSTRDRATVVMACGSGKTLMALWAAEQADPKRVLVLVPSLNLLRQTLHEWAKWTNWGERFRYLCVCSDPTVAKGIDEIEIRPEDVDFPVRTDPAIVGQFLDGGDGCVSVVFCTYQSAPVVGEAINNRQPFDLGIFDEAHKATGRENTRFAFALTDENLPIRKRLFLTATPRHYDIRKRDREGDFAVASMDDERVYGRVAHRLTFAQAAAQKIIVPYKVVISVVDSEMIDNALLDRSEVVIEGEPVRAKWVAHQIALKRAVEQHNLKRVITFHSSIKAAAAFASDDVDGVGTHMPNFRRFHVSGAQPTADRDAQVRDFATAQRGVITNARCLTEGVDVPSVEMVAFMNPRRSRVDIVQAVGRAMRTAGADKTCGYVLVPLFLEMRKDETLGAALERSDFDEIAQVLNAMRENDDELSEIIQTLSIQRGQTGGFDESRLREKVEVLGPQLEVGELAASIRTRIVESIRVSWDLRYGELVTFHARYGHCNVPVNSVELPVLGQWIAHQRQLKKRGLLSNDRARKLDNLGFDWSWRSSSWDWKLDSLRAYKRQFGDCLVPVAWPEDADLGAWVARQRRARKRGKLSSERVAQLDSLGFMWDPIDHLWETAFSRVESLSQEFAEAGKLPAKLLFRNRITEWMTRQRSLRDRGLLSKEKIDRLDRVGFRWSSFDDAWEGRFQQLKEYRVRFGHCDVPKRWSEDPALGNWLTIQRRWISKGKRVTSEQVARLSDLGVKFSVAGSRWEQRVEELRQYRMRFGDAEVPFDWPENRSLGIWINEQRKAKRKGLLSTRRIEVLDGLGISWTPIDSKWQRRISELRAFRDKFGHCNVPVTWIENRELGIWVANQRQRKRRGKLADERVAELEEIGFQWSVRES